MSDKLVKIFCGLESGELGLADVWEMGFSTSERCALALTLPGCPLPEAYPSVGDAWQRLDDGQRALVEQHAPLTAILARREAALSEVADHGRRR